MNRRMYGSKWNESTVTVVFQGCNGFSEDQDSNLKST